VTFVSGLTLILMLDHCLVCGFYISCVSFSSFYFFSYKLYCFVFISVYVMLLLAVLVTIGPSAFNKFGLVWFEDDDNA